ncbi:MAG: hypothetical protein KY445_15255, partial [Armatimonadetes bacterium]|nr:hypothetical protein [Armatimonadota bacterium]
ASTSRHTLVQKIRIMLIGNAITLSELFVNLAFDEQINTKQKRKWPEDKPQVGDDDGQHIPARYAKRKCTKEPSEQADATEPEACFSIFVHLHLTKCVWKFTECGQAARKRHNSVLCRIIRLLSAERHKKPNIVTNSSHWASSVGVVAESGHRGCFRVRIKAIQCP